jgi:hypothetical protein
MFQPEVKLEFVRRYCPPKEGWKVFVDIDASEEGRTGGSRKTPEAQERCEAMQAAGQRVRKELDELGVKVGESRRKWLAGVGATRLHESFPCVATDRDIVALHPERRHLLIAEVEGASSGQPEQKLYKAIGQLVLAIAKACETDWQAAYVLAVHGEAIAGHLQRASVLAKLGISALHIKSKDEQVWLFLAAPLPKLLSDELRVPAALPKLEAST